MSACARAHSPLYPQAVRAHAPASASRAGCGAPARLLGVSRGRDRADERTMHVEPMTPKDMARAHAATGKRPRTGRGHVVICGSDLANLAKWMPAVSVGLAARCPRWSSSGPLSGFRIVGSAGIAVRRRMPCPHRQHAIVGIGLTGENPQSAKTQPLASDWPCVAHVRARWRPLQPLAYRACVRAAATRRNVREHARIPPLTNRYFAKNEKFSWPAGTSPNLSTLHL
jgi:hypothetical protein